MWGVSSFIRNPAVTTVDGLPLGLNSETTEDMLSTWTLQGVRVGQKWGSVWQKFVYKIVAKTNFIILLICFIVFIFATRGYSILYLFLFADLLCCAAVVTIFYGFFNKKINPKLAAYSIPLGLIFGLLFYPSQNFETSILVGNLISADNFSIFIRTNLLFIAFFVSLFVPLIIIFSHSLRNSFR